MSASLEDAQDLSALLARAQGQGIITAEQAGAIAALARSEALALPHDDERLRFITGFADLFVTIGLALFLGAAAWFAVHTLHPVLAFVIVAAVSWLLADVFTRRRRMALPSITLLGAFLSASFVALASAWNGLSGASALRGTALATLDHPSTVLIAALATVLLAGLHYLRFRVPITIAAATAALIAGVLAGLDLALPGVVAAHAMLLIVFAGLAAFALAMRFDLSDPRRTTRASDIAFWLHMLAAPLIVHPLLGPLGTGTPTLESSAALLVAVLGLALVALLVDRRALLVSGLVYAGVAVGRIVETSGFAGESLPFSLLLLGAFVLTLSAAWHRLRRLLLALLPPPAAARLPLPMDLR